MCTYISFGCPPLTSLYGPYAWISRGLTFFLFWYKIMISKKLIKCHRRKKTTPQSVHGLWGVVLGWLPNYFRSNHLQMKYPTTFTMTERKKLIICDIGAPPSCSQYRGRQRYNYTITCLIRQARFLFVTYMQVTRRFSKVGI